jgi:hypothetical protein
MDLNDLFIDPYNGNEAGAARISSNSFGRDAGGSYDTHCMTVDQFMWLHPDFLVFFPVGSGMEVASPASAKNVVSVGATMNGANADIYYAMSAPGPTEDGRYKPTICVPGELYTAFCSHDAAYMELHGTSFACPAAAGATVLLREYLTRGWYPTGTQVAYHAMPNPSAALMKAMAINCASDDIQGFTVPSNYIGWGRILLDDALYFAGDERRLAIIDFTDGLLTGESAEYEVSVESSEIPLKATLVWTDYPGHPGAGIQLVNDLNLVADSGSEVYLGNVYADGQSLPGGEADFLNVEECVRRENPEVGIWTFRIEAFNVPFGPQPFALVVTGGLGGFAGGAAQSAPTPRFVLHACAPDPFHRSTTVRFAIPARSRVTLSVHDITGRRVRTLLQRVVAGGLHSIIWDGEDSAGRPVRSGVYLCQLRTDRFSQGRRLTLLR